jgi:hypothetical protein
MIRCYFKELGITGGIAVALVVAFATCWWTKEIFDFILKY